MRNKEYYMRHIDLAVKNYVAWKDMRSSMAKDITNLLINLYWEHKDANNPENQMELF